jgi:two-component system cell cycle response regulator CpdR
MTRVLIADDEDSMRSLVARAIAMDGHETVTAEDGAEALDILTRERGTGLNAIVHDVVTKPFSVHDIRTAVADALAARKNG